MIGFRFFFVDLLVAFVSFVFICFMFAFGNICGNIFKCCFHDVQSCFGRHILGFVFEFWGSLVHMKHLVGALEYIASWRWSDSDSTLISVHGSGYSFPYTELHLRGHYENTSLCTSNSDYHLFGLPAYSSGQTLFPTAFAAFGYWHSLCRVDLMLRGFRDARLHAFTLKLQANFLLLQRVLTADRHELPLLEAQWTLLNRAPVADRQWSPQQTRFLDHVHLGFCLSVSLVCTVPDLSCVQHWQFYMVFMYVVLRFAFSKLIVAFILSLSLCVEAQ